MSGVDDHSAWVGRSEEAADVAAAGPIRRLAALLDHETPPWAPCVVPPLGHWLYFLPEARQSSLGPDGHPARGGFLPPVALPRRMWAGGRIAFFAPIPFDAPMTRRSTIASVTPKTGASGPMVFVVVRYEIFAGGQMAISEEQDIVYRGAGRPGPSPSAPEAESDFHRLVSLGPVALFRYSALTFNGHRIHYDRNYATKEGYPDLVVHGPLVATLLVDHLLRWRPAAPLTRFVYRARAPLFDSGAFALNLRRTESGANLWAQAPGGPVNFEADATIAE